MVPPSPCENRVNNNEYFKQLFKSFVKLYCTHTNVSTYSTGVFKHYHNMGKLNDTVHKFVVSTSCVNIVISIVQSV